MKCQMQEVLEKKGWKHFKQGVSPKLAHSPFNIMEMGRSAYLKQGLSIINNGKPTVFADFETDRDFTAPNLLSWSCVWTKNGTPVKSITNHTDGVMNDKNRWIEGKHKPHFKEACPCGCGESFRKNISKRTGVTRIDKRKGAKVQMAYGWMYADEVKDLWPVVLEKLHEVSYGTGKMSKLSKKDTHMTVYAHNMVVDYIAMETSMGNIDGNRHPFKNLVSVDSDDKKFIPRGSGMLAVNIDMTDYMSDKFERRFVGKDFKIETDKHFPTEWRDSFALMPTALAPLSEVVGMKKGETPEKFINANHEDFGKKEAITTDDIHYAVNDTVSLLLITAAFLRTVSSFGYQRHDLPYTISSAGYHIIASSYAKECLDEMPRLFSKEKPSSKSYFTNVADKFLDTMLRRDGILVGGMTRVFNRHLHGFGSFVAVDGRSFYPSAMIVRLIKNSMYGDIQVFMPDWTTMKQYKGNNLQELLDSEYEGAVYCHWVRPDTEEIGIIPNTVESGVRKGSLDWDAQEGKRWLTLFQARFAVSRGYVLTPETFEKRELNGNFKVVHSETEEGVKTVEPLYDEFSGWAIVCDRMTQATREVLVKPVHKAYNTRLEQKKNKDPMAFLTKIVLNGGISFGKFGEMRENTFITTEHNYIENFDDADWDFKPVVEEVGCIYGYATSNEKQSAPNACHLFASYITDVARCMLVSMADTIGASNIVYCDTDSWRFRTENVSKATLKEIESTYGAELTQWDKEYDADYFEAVAPKSYKFRDSNTNDVTVKMKGVSIKSAIQKAWVALSHAERVAYGYTGTNLEHGQATKKFKNDWLWTLDLYDEIVADRVNGIRSSFRNGSEAGVWQEVKKQMKVRT